MNLWHLATAARGGQPRALSTVHSVSDHHHALKLVPFVDPTEARKDAGHARAVGGTELE